jgi:hypothetical protein
MIAGCQRGTNRANPETPQAAPRPEISDADFARRHPKRFLVPDPLSLVSAGRTPRISLIEIEGKSPLEK